MHTIDSPPHSLLLVLLSCSGVYNREKFEKVIVFDWTKRARSMKQRCAPNGSLICLFSRSFMGSHVLVTDTHTHARAHTRTHARHRLC